MSIHFRRRARLSAGKKPATRACLRPRTFGKYIDGDAEQYISAGVVSTSTSDYKYQDQLEAVVDVYTMGDFNGCAQDS